MFYIFDKKNIIIISTMLIDLNGKPKSDVVVKSAMVMSLFLMTVKDTCVS
jgi:hypothetical protein